MPARGPAGVRRESVAANEDNRAYGPMISIPARRYRRSELIFPPGLRGYVTSGDQEAVQRIRYRASNHGGTPPPGALTQSASSYTSTSPTSAMPTYSSPNAYARPTYNGSSSNRPLYRRMSDFIGRKLWKTKVAPASLLFKDSPFYEVKEALTNKLELPRK